MRFLLSSCILFLASLVHAGEPPAARLGKPPPARRMAATRCSCAACVCATPGGCGDGRCRCATPQTALTRGMRKAVTENRPLLIWVQEVCPYCEARMSDYVHAHVSAYKGEHDLVTDSCVIISRPDGRGGLIRLATLPGLPSAEQVATVLSSR